MFNLLFNFKILKFFYNWFFFIYFIFQSFIFFKKIFKILYFFFFNFYKILLIIAYNNKILKNIIILKRLNFFFFKKIFLTNNVLYFFFRFLFLKYRMIEIYSYIVNLIKKNIFVKLKIEEEQKNYLSTKDIIKEVYPLKKVINLNFKDLKIKEIAKINFLKFLNFSYNYLNNQLSNFKFNFLLKKNLKFSDILYIRDISNSYDLKKRKKKLLLNNFFIIKFSNFFFIFNFLKFNKNNIIKNYSKNLFKLNFLFFYFFFFLKIRL